MLLLEKLLQALTADESGEGREGSAEAVTDEETMMHNDKHALQPQCKYSYIDELKTNMHTADVLHRTITSAQKASCSYIEPQMQLADLHAGGAPAEH